MVRRNYSQELKQIVRSLRKEPTSAEKKLWMFLRNKRLDGIKFRRQHPVGGYILDIYCPAANLGVELDGGVHEEKEQSEYDRQREKNLSSLGVKIIRFWNSEVEGEIDVVLQAILDEVRKRQSKESG